jgi:hypothetical protein
MLFQPAGAQIGRFLEGGDIGLDIQQGRARDAKRIGNSLNNFSLLNLGYFTYSRRNVQENLIRNTHKFAQWHIDLIQ